MFGKKSDQSESASVSQASVKPELWGEIYTMPNTYQSPVVHSKGSKKVLIIALIILLVAIVGLVVYLLIKSSNSKTEVIGPETNQNIVETTPVPNPATPTELVTAAERDRVRFRDIREIQAALELYFAESKSYPLAPLSMVLGTSSSNTLSAAGFSGSPQGAIYLDEVPANPEPGGNPYLYESLDGLTYNLHFRLEEGTANLIMGDHIASPLGIDEKAPIIQQPVTPKQITPPLATEDSDNDTLTDEEELVVGSDKTKPDTDSDGYTDGSEVASGYDPTLGVGATLASSSKFKAYISEKFAYTLTYPSSWEVEVVDHEGSEILLSTGNAEFMEILVVGNTDKLTAAAWYAKQFTSLSVGEVPEFKSGQYSWALSPDGLNAYLATEKNIITFSYNIGTADRASYYQLFRAMLRLFAVSASEQLLPQPEVSNPGNQ